MKQIISDDMPETKKLLEILAPAFHPVEIHCPKCGNPHFINPVSGGFTINNLRTDLYWCGYCGMQFGIGKGVPVK